ncbi:MAG: phage holin family protein [Chania sp.]|jgi:hypothetical protein
MVNDPLVILNVMLCTAIVIRMAFFQRQGKRHRVFVSWLALGIIILYASVPIRFFYQLYTETHWWMVACNLVICIAVFRAKGNVAKLFAVPKASE